MLKKITVSLFLLLIPAIVYGADVLSAFSNETLPTLNDNLRQLEDEIRELQDVNGSTFESINLANGTGTVPVTSVGTGTANNTTFLRGDQTFVQILKMSQVSYTGDGNDNRWIAHELQSTPQVVIINRADIGDLAPVIWTTSMGSGLSRLFSGGHRADSIQDVNATHVQIGTEIEVNEASEVYDMITFAEQ